MSQLVLKTESVSKTFSLKGKKVTALRGLDLEVKRGEFIAIMGLSGSGKTTLLNILACLDRPSTGKVFLDNINLAELRDSQALKDKKRQDWFRIPELNLLPYLNARENVELAMEKDQEIKEGEKRASPRVLGLVGLSGREEHLPAS